jgi:NADPH2:quinone reductase
LTRDRWIDSAKSDGRERGDSHKCVNASGRSRIRHAHVIRFDRTGGPDILTSEEIAVGDPGLGEARVRHTAVGLNYGDIYVRHGLYPARLPSGIGTEAAGVVEAVGPDVSEVRRGDRVAYAGGPLGAYSEVRIMPADRLVVLPAGISDVQAAAMILKGVTAQYLIHQIHKVATGDIILFHAAAGGVGLIACQWAKSLGATVIGTVGSEAKAKVAQGRGCDHPIIYTREDFVATRRGTHQRREAAGGL